MTNPDPGAEWWTTSDVAAYLGVRVGKVATYRKRGQMPAPDLTLGRTHALGQDETAATPAGSRA
ncbi:hypothetical protein ABZ328_16695 [Micromonospora aurantiaca]|uniref:hypothetical protein n=1 Tax=Micromonospora aurantiaca (nom. illeg.) TaxID=47850 RepID=UPI0033F3440B